MMTRLPRQQLIHSAGQRQNSARSISIRFEHIPMSRRYTSPLSADTPAVRIRRLCQNQPDTGQTKD